ncbi:serine/threonine-protein kinase [Streptomyces sp. SCL15-4]|uniref:serine/threonine-protein kinase n=1 Tax=Streptomyces sp. SCL15-4 TaxID=2967221 RepID=UPI002966365D|nr:protein kinase [Streptomyces sp. SCL15-4]
MSAEPGRERVIAGRYRLLSALGEGGMGTVWRARDEVLRREVAVKEVRAPGTLPGPDVERMYARLEREAWAAARVAHRGVVTVYDVALEAGRPWIVMELVRGLSLADRLAAKGPLPPAEAARVGAEVLSALRAAHAVGVLHRDVKPANVLLANDGRVVLTDFGIASLEGSSALTMTGEVIGSPEYLSPERALGRTPGPEADLWSLGVLLYTAVEGVSPFRQNTALSTLRAVVDEELPPPLGAGPLAAVVEGLLRKDPAERTAAERAEHELRIVAAGGTPEAPARPVPPSTAATLLAGPGEEERCPAPGPSAVPQPSATQPSVPPGRTGRAGAVLVAGALVAVLALAGLAYVLTQRDGDGQGSRGAPSGGGAATSAPHGGGTSSATAAGTSAGGRPEQSVGVAVAGERTEYSGACPPPGGRAPAFTATFTVERLPARVEYRWVTTRGSVSDPGWRTLSFPAGGGRTRQVRVTLTVYKGGASAGDRVGVKVREPVKAASDTVPFSVDCARTATETPPGGPPSSASASASPSASASASASASKSESATGSP